MLRDPIHSKPWFIYLIFIIDLHHLPSKSMYSYFISHLIFPPIFISPYLNNIDLLRISFKFSCIIIFFLSLFLLSFTILLIDIIETLFFSLIHYVLYHQIGIGLCNYYFSSWIISFYSEITINLILKLYLINYIAP